MRKGNFRPCAQSLISGIVASDSTGNDEARPMCNYNQFQRCRLSDSWCPKIDEILFQICERRSRISRMKSFIRGKPPVRTIRLLPSTRPLDCPNIAYKEIFDLQEKFQTCSNCCHSMTLRQVQATAADHLDIPLAEPNYCASDRHPRPYDKAMPPELVVP